MGARLMPDLPRPVTDPWGARIQHQPAETEHRPEHVYAPDPATCANCEQAWPCDFERGRKAERQRLVAMLRSQSTGGDSPYSAIHRGVCQYAADLIESEQNHD